MTLRHYLYRLQKDALYHGIRFDHIWARNIKDHGFFPITK
jgi:hypothetical protein